MCSHRLFYVGDLACFLVITCARRVEKRHMLLLLSLQWLAIPKFKLSINWNENVGEVS